MLGSVSHVDDYIGILFSCPALCNADTAFFLNRYDFRNISGRLLLFEKRKHVIFPPNMYLIFIICNSHNSSNFRRYEKSSHLPKEAAAYH